MPRAGAGGRVPPCSRDSSPALLPRAARGGSRPGDARRGGHRVRQARRLRRRPRRALQGGGARPDEPRHRGVQRRRAQPLRRVARQRRHRVVRPRRRERPASPVQGGAACIGFQLGCERSAHPMPDALAITHDGRFLYAAGAGSEDGLLAFTRDAGTGALAPAGCLHGYRDACAFPGGAGSDGIRALEVSPDDRFLVSATGTGVGVVNRDPATGALSQTPGNCVIGEDRYNSYDEPSKGCRVDERLGRPAEMDLSPDGATVYVAAEERERGSGGLLVFARDAATGQIALTSGSAAATTRSGEPRRPQRLRRDRAVRRPRVRARPRHRRAHADPGQARLPRLRQGLHPAEGRLLARGRARLARRALRVPRRRRGRQRAAPGRRRRAQPGGGQGGVQRDDDELDHALERPASAITAATSSTGSRASRSRRAAATSTRSRAPATTTTAPASCSSCSRH